MKYRSLLASGLLLALAACDLQDSPVPRSGGLAPRIVSNQGASLPGVDSVMVVLTVQGKPPVVKLGKWGGSVVFSEIAYGSGWTMALLGFKHRTDSLGVDTLWRGSESGVLQPSTATSKVTDAVVGVDASPQSPSLSVPASALRDPVAGTVIVLAAPGSGGARVVAGFVATSKRGGLTCASPSVASSGLVVPAFDRDTTFLLEALTCLADGSSSTRLQAVVSSQGTGVTGLALQADTTHAIASWNVVQGVGYKVEWDTGSKAATDPLVHAALTAVSPFEIDDLAAGATYSVAVSRQVAGGYGPRFLLAVRTADRIQGAARVGHLVSVADSNSMNLSWDSLPGAPVYRVEWAQGILDTSMPFEKTDITGSAHFRMDGLLPGKAYTAVVSVYDPAKRIRSRVVDTTSIPHMTGIGASADLARIVLSWSAVPGADGYKVLWEQGAVSDLAGLSNSRFSPVLKDSIRNLQPSTAYTFAMAAVVDGVVGPYVLRTVSTTSRAQLPVEATVVAFAGRVQLDWNDVAGATEYQLSWRHTGAAVELGSRKTTRSDAVVDGLVPGRDYAFTVVAKAADTLGTGTVETKTRALPSAPSAVRLGSLGDSLFWAPPASGSGDYVYRIRWKNSEASGRDTTTATSVPLKSVPYGKLGLLGIVISAYDKLADTVVSADSMVVRRSQLVSPQALGVRSRLMAIQWPDASATGLATLVYLSKGVKAGASPLQETTLPVVWNGVDTLKGLLPGTAYSLRVLGLSKNDTLAWFDTTISTPALPPRLDAVFQSNPFRVSWPDVVATGRRYDWKLLAADKSALDSGSLAGTVWNDSGKLPNGKAGTFLVRVHDSIAAAAGPIDSVDVVGPASVASLPPRLQPVFQTSPFLVSWNQGIAGARRYFWTLRRAGATDSGSLAGLTWNDSLELAAGQSAMFIVGVFDSVQGLMGPLDSVGVKRQAPTVVPPAVEAVFRRNPFLVSWPDSVKVHRLYHWMLTSLTGAKLDSGATLGTTWNDSSKVMGGRKANLLLKVFDSTAMAYGPESSVEVVGPVLPVARLQARFSGSMLDVSWSNPSGYIRPSLQFQIGAASATTVASSSFLSDSSAVLDVSRATMGDSVEVSVRSLPDGSGVQGPLVRLKVSVPPQLSFAVIEQSGGIYCAEPSQLPSGWTFQTEAYRFGVDEPAASVAMPASGAGPNCYLDRATSSNPTDHFRFVGWLKNLGDTLRTVDSLFAPVPLLASDATDSVFALPVPLRLDAPTKAGGKMEYEIALPPNLSRSWVAYDPDSIQALFGTDSVRVRMAPATGMASIVSRGHRIYIDGGFERPEFDRVWATKSLPHAESDLADGAFLRNELLMTNEYTTMGSSVRYNLLDGDRASACDLSARVGFHFRATAGAKALRSIPVVRLIHRNSVQAMETKDIMVALDTQGGDRYIADFAGYESILKTLVAIEIVFLTPDDYRLDDIEFR